MPALKKLLQDLRLVKGLRLVRGSGFGEAQEGKWYHLKNLKKNRRLQIAGGITAATLAGLGAYHANKRGLLDSKATRNRKADEKHKAEEVERRKAAKAAKATAKTDKAVNAARNAKAVKAARASKTSTEENPEDIAARYEGEAGFKLFFGKKKNFKKKN